jgi:hypothetical protein
MEGAHEEKVRHASLKQCIQTVYGAVFRCVRTVNVCKRRNTVAAFLEHHQFRLYPTRYQQTLLTWKVASGCSSAAVIRIWLYPPMVGLLVLSLLALLSLACRSISARKCGSDTCGNTVLPVSPLQQLLCVCSEW